MRKVELKVKEELKYNVIKEVVHHGLNKKAAAVKLGCSLRSVNRYIHIFKEKGKEGFVHGNRGRKPAITFPEDFRKMVIQLYQDEYQDVSFTQFAEFIQEDFHMSISPNTLANWFKDAFICSPLCHKKTRTRMKRLLKVKIENSHSRKEKTSLQFKEDNLYALDARDAHPTLHYYFAKVKTDFKTPFSNGREVRNLYERTINNQADRLAMLSSISDEELQMITKDDIIRATSVEIL